MEIEESEDINELSNCEESHTACSAVNNLILDYYKKFGRKRDLEQFFSLSTAQSEVRDPHSLFWRRMKSQDESSDSGGKKSESSTELCRISIKCSIPEPSTSQVEESRIKSYSESPPIISEEVISEPNKTSDNESVKSDDVQSQKSIDGTLDTSMNKPHSPTSSITSQRKLEWDSLADVGYANESDRKNSASSLSTLERMALQQQYSCNDTKNTDIGQPTAQSTPFDPNEAKPKNKKGAVKKTTKIYKKDIDSVELSIPQNSENNPPHPINLNLTKHISFNVDRSGSVVIENSTKSVSLSPEKVSVETEVTPQIKIDKEIQTTLNRSKDKSCGENVKEEEAQSKRYPVLISLNTLKKKSKKKKVRKIKRQHSKKRLIANKENVPLEKSGDQLSEAESFEYMPGHIYNQNQINAELADNKSSLESSGLTTDSSKTTKNSFTKDLEKNIDILKSALEQQYEDANLKKNLIKQIVQKLVESKYKGDKSSSEILSGLSFKSKTLGLGDYNNYITTSTSDTNNTANEIKQSKPKKSILRMEKFNTNPIASTSQSVPNIPIFTKNEKPAGSSKIISRSNTDSDFSKENKAFSDVGMDKTSSEELYKKYLEALKREQAYKRHLKDKEMFLKQKRVSSDAVHTAIRQIDSNAQNRIKDLMKDLIRNNYDDGSGDASKMEGGSRSVVHIEKFDSLRKQRSHSVFTLSSGNSENHGKNAPLAHKYQNEAGSSKLDSKIEKHYCCCPLHALRANVGVTDSSVQVNIKTCGDKDCTDCKRKEIFQHPAIPESELSKCEKCKSPKNRVLQTVPEATSHGVKYVCLCTDEGVTPQEMPDNFLIYKCSRLPSKSLKLEDIVSKVANTASGSSSNFTSPRQKISSFKSHDCEKKCLVLKDSSSTNNQTSKSSQTNVNLPINLRSTTSQQSISSFTSREYRENVIEILGPKSTKTIFIHEATRCIQTEISIDPKISDPSLADINIVNDDNCVELISERYKQVSQPVSENTINNQFANKNDQVQGSGSSLPESKRKLPTESDKCTSTSAEDDFIIVQKVDKEVQYIPDNIPSKGVKENYSTQHSDNFTLPIQGTNMTLKVSLGTRTNSPTLHENKIKDFVSENKLSQGTETIKPPVAENATSLQEECSKAVQSSELTIFEEFYQNPSKNSCGSRNGDDFDPRSLCVAKSKKTLTKPSVDACVTTDYKYNTYPAEDRSHIQKPLLRSNTDPSKIEKASHVTFYERNVKDIGVTPDVLETEQRQLETILPTQKEKSASSCSEISPKSMEMDLKSKISSDIEKQPKSSGSETDTNTKKQTSKDPVLEIIQDITKRYAKKDIERNKRKKGFKELITVLSYLLDTEDSSDHDQKKSSCSSAFDEGYTGENLTDKKSADSMPAKTLVDKAVQLSTKKSKPHKICTDSSDLPLSTDFPSTSSDAATCKVLNKIKRECEKYHQKRCKSHASSKQREESSSTSVNCDHCRLVHHCSCRGHKCKSHKTKTTVEKTKKKCVAYNLIIQTSDSIISEEMNGENNRRQLQNIIVKVPSKRKVENVPFKELSKKIEKNMPHCSPRCDTRGHRSKSLPNDSEISSTDEIIKKAQDHTVREFLEKNRPDFIEKCSNRQECLKIINETRASERAAKRQLLSLQLERRQALNALSESDLKDFARALGDEMRRKKVPKFISEREMKKHSEKIYKSLPEVVQKKEEIKKETIKKTNLLMANIFKKNLQKRALRGTINISNYSSVIKI